MNKNVIKISLLLGASIMTDIPMLSVPAIDLYADNLCPKGRFINNKESLTLNSNTNRTKLYHDGSESINSLSIGIKVRSVLSAEFDDAAILMSVVERIEQSKPLPAEFSKMIDDNFWDLF